MTSPDLNILLNVPLLYHFIPFVKSCFMPCSARVLNCFYIDSTERHFVPFFSFVAIIFYIDSLVGLNFFVAAIKLCIDDSSLPLTNPSGGYSPILTNISFSPLLYYVHPDLVFFHSSYFSGSIQSFSFFPYIGLFLPAIIPFNFSEIR